MCKKGKCVEYNCGYKCECDCGYTGRYCDIPLSACSYLSDGSSKCLNNGICIENGCNFTCNCTPGYTGQFCQIRKNPCDPSNCLNGATCVASVNDYTCKCPCKYYSGKNCQVGNEQN